MQRATFICLIGFVVACRHSVVAPATGTVTVVSVTPTAIDAGASATLSWTSTIAGDFIVHVTTSDTFVARATITAGATLTTTVPASALSAGENSGEVIVFSAAGEPSRATFSLTLNASAASSGGTTGGSTGGPVSPCTTTTISSGDYSQIGDGTPASPWILCTPDQLNALSYASGAWGNSFALGADLDMSAFGPSSGVPYLGIGSTNAPFSGTFDGQGHTIANVTINQPAQDNVGFFGQVYGSAAVVERLVLSQVSITGRDQTGGLAGYSARATILDCSTTGTVTGRNKVGGLLGEIDQATLLSTGASAAAVSATRDDAGGLIGRMELGTELFSSEASGAVSGRTNVGGLVGYATYFTEVWDCYATGNVSSVDGYAAGLVGYGTAMLLANSFCTGNVTSTGDNSGANPSSPFFARDASGSDEATINSYYYSGSCTVAGNPCSAPPPDNEIAESSPTYFQSTGTAPQSGWDFTRTWAAQAGALPVPAPQLFDYTGWGDCSTHQSDVPFAGGYGAPEAPFLICTQSQLANMANPNLWQGKTFRLMDDIVMNFTAPNPTTWQPIGNDTATAWLMLDGNGKTISNFAPAPDAGRQSFGLFGYTNGGVKRLGMVDAKVISTDLNVGIIGGILQGTTADCFVTGSVSGDQWVGGITGNEGGIVIDSYSTATVTSNNDQAAGISPVPDQMYDCFAASDISSAFDGGPIAGYGGYSTANIACTAGGVSPDSYYDSSTSCAGCCPTNSGDGSAVASDWFYSATNPPMSTWDFVHVWQANSGTYPTLR